MELEEDERLFESLKEVQGSMNRLTSSPRPLREFNKSSEDNR